LEFFDISEFDSPDLKGSGEKMDKVFIHLLDKARSIAQVPFKITSGYRTKQWNLKVGGRIGSSHCLGYAADIYLPNNSRERFLIINALFKVGLNRIGINFKGKFVHVDMDRSKDKNVLWTY
jgi:zinc D-Ala-D-Ala carboxypeptidase|tara:strand:- start:1076 stop:1438 length:363 start_codon:yes stop_codon:yes gene_type:complete